MRARRNWFKDVATGVVTEVDIAGSAPLAEVKGEAVAAVRRMAERKILAILPEYMQRNLSARAIELTARHAGLTPDQWPEPDRSEWNAGLALWTRIKAVRDASNAIEAEIAARTTGAEVFDLAEALAANPLWPE